MPRILKMTEGKATSRTEMLSKTSAATRTLLGSAFLAMTLLGTLAGCSSGSGSSSGGATATPTFTPAGGTFSTSQTVTVGDATAGAVLYCTEDGSTPTTSSSVCPEPVTVAKSETLSAIAVAPGFSDSAVAKAAFVISLNPIATPVISPGGGTFVSVQTVTISDSTSGSTILYTTDGSNPATSTTAIKYGGSIAVSSSETVNAVAEGGAGFSAEASAVFAINLPSVPAPVISPAGGTFATTQSVSITDTNTSAVIYYTTDGSTPTSASTKYTGAITVATSETINAIATLNGEAVSQVTTATFTLTGGGQSQMLPDPLISPNGGAFASVPQLVTITDTNTSALIYYTLDGSTPPSATAILYTKPISLENAGAINAIAIESGYLNSNVVTANFAFNLTPAATPVFSLPSGPITSAQQLTITDTTPGASIYYCIAASGQTCIPTIDSTLYTGAIAVDASEVIEAIATAPGFDNSAAAVGTYTIDLPAVLTPVISPSSFSIPQLVTITDYVSGATITYTTDGSDPATSSTAVKYTVPFAISSSTAGSNGMETINAIATAPNYAQSTEASVTYTIQTPTPTLSAPGGPYAPGFTLAITDVLPNAAIYYTTDGSNPTTSSKQYTAPIAIAGSVQITAIAVAPNYAVSIPTAATQFSPVPGSNTEPTPTFKVDSGTASTSLTVEIDDTDPNAFIFYSVTGGGTGEPPTESSSIFTPLPDGVPITIAATQTIEAFALSQNQTKYSSVATQTFTITAPEPPPVLPAGGTVTTPVDLAGTTDADSTATIYYTVDGSQPSATNGANLTAGADVVLSSGSTTVNAIAVSATGIASTVATATYTVNLPLTPMPTLSEPTGTYTGTQLITVTDTDTSASLIYSTDMTNWAQVPPLGIPVTTSETLFVIAQDQPRNLDSAVASATYTLTLPITATPTFSPTPGTYPTAQTVTIGDDTTGSTIYYTLDGSTPTTSSSVYNGPISVTATETIKALASGASGYEPSAIATATYTIQAGNTLSLTGTVTSAGNGLVGATVTLYAAGTTGYGSAPASKATATSGDGGAFSLSGFTCPAAPGDQLYLVASVPGSGVQLLAGLGSCGNFSSSSSPVYTVNEATTIASAYALSGFMAPASNGGVNIGAPTTSFNATTKQCPVTAVGNSGCNYTGLANAFNTIPNLVDLTTGAVLTITPYYDAAGGTSGGSLNSSYVPQARIDTLANILAACGSSSSQCSTLFTDAKPSSGSAPTSSLQAALDIALNPGNNVSSLYGLSSVVTPFTPKLTSAPTDWTIALTFTGGGLGWETGAGLNPTSAPEPIGLAVDSVGDLWMNANNGSFYALVEFDNQGEPLSPPLTGNFVGGLSDIKGGYQNAATDSVGSSNALAIDQSDQVWIASSGETLSYLAAVDASGNPVVQNTESAYTAQSSVQGLAVDRTGNILETYSAQCDLQSYSAADGAALLSESGCTGNISITSYDQVAFDPSGNIWTLSTYGANTGEVVELGAVISSPVDQLQAFLNGADYSLAIDSLGNVFAPSQTTPGTITRQNQSSAQFSSYQYPLPTNAEGVTAVAVDGAGHLWGASFSGSASFDPTIPSYLIEMTNTGTLLSPQGTGIYGYSGTGGGGETQPILANYRKGISGIAVDGSGNVWVTNLSLPNKNFSTAKVGEQLVEFIGVATPIVTPTSVALTNNALATKP